jgi:hypothetical protein
MAADLRACYSISISLLPGLLQSMMCCCPDCAAPFVPGPAARRHAGKKGATHSTQAPPSAPVQQQQKQKQKQRARGAFADAEQDGIDEDEAAWQGAPPCQDMQLPPAGPPQAGPHGAGDDAAPASTSTRRAAVRRHMRTQQKQQHAPGGEDDTGEDGG